PQISNQAISFNLRTTTDTYLYDIYLISPSDSLHYRFANQGEGLLPVAFKPTVEPGQTMTIYIYGYDANLAEYLTAVTTIKYQTYLETVTTVTGGYGVFGSVNVAKMRLILPCRSRICCSLEEIHTCTSTFPTTDITGLALIFSQW
ncbi:unnamed protein product, partial [marine sediment metagenome]